MLCLRAIYNIILHIQYNPIRQHEQQKDNRNNIVCFIAFNVLFLLSFCCSMLYKTIIAYKLLLYKQLLSYKDVVV